MRILRNPEKIKNDITYGIIELGEGSEKLSSDFRYIFDDKLKLGDTVRLDAVDAESNDPGREYENTRHNVGWLVLDRLAAEGGIDILDIREEYYRRNCVLCSQFPLFIKGSVRDNFKLQNPDITDKEILYYCGGTGCPAGPRSPEADRGDRGESRRIGRNAGSELSGLALLQV